MRLCDIGVMGLAVMGSNLARNFEEHGFRVAVYDRDASFTDAFMKDAEDGNFVRCDSPGELCAALKSPRVIFVMIRAGAPVDQTLETFLPLLSAGDVFIDGGNSLYTDTIRRVKLAKARGVEFMGVGVSGGAEGARRGPSLMPGGSKAAWERVAPMLTAVAAKAADGEPCCAYIGTDGAGHFVKMVHNGIEYGDMQLICESYHLLRALAGLDEAAMRAVFEEWNRGKLSSYLVEITAKILGVIDEKTGEPLVRHILDCAGQKGTGMWTSQQSLILGVAAPTIAEAVYARCLSADKATRVAASKALDGPNKSFDGDKKQLVDDIAEALYASKICSYAQGFAILSAASRAYHWDLDFAAIARSWRGGCIIRAQFLDDIARAYERDANLSNLLLDETFRAAISRAQDAWRRVVANAAFCGVPAPSFSSALSYYDGVRSEQLPANLLQAQRDFFGAHTYKRNDMGGVFHTDWE